MKFTDWKSEFNQFYRGIREGSLVDDLIRLNWQSVTYSQINELSEDIDLDIYHLTPEEYCGLLPVLLDAISGNYRNLLESLTFGYLLGAPKSRLRSWEKDHLRRQKQYDQARFDRILTAAASEMNVEFDPDERSRSELLGPYNNRQRTVLILKVDSYLKLPEHHLGYEEHPFASELEGLRLMLSAKISTE